MANKNYLLGMLVLVLVFGMTVVGCGGVESQYDNYARLILTNTSSITYYTSEERTNDGRLVFPYKLDPGRSNMYHISWNDGESSNITIYYASDQNSTNSLSRTYYNFRNDERRELNFP